MKKRGNLKTMLRLIRLVRPLTGFMILAILMGVLGFLCAIMIPVLGAAAALSVLGFAVPIGTTPALVLAVICGLLRGILRYGEQACNHYIAFKLLALIRDHVFGALRKLCPAKLEGKDRGDLIALITSDIELLEVFYAHTISPAAIALVVSVLMALLIGALHPLLGVIALAGYVLVGAILPVMAAKRGGTAAWEFRKSAGALSSFVLESLRGIKESIQYGAGEARLLELEERSAHLAGLEERMKRAAGRNTAVTNTVILLVDLAVIIVGGRLFTNSGLGFAETVLAVVAVMSSFGPVVALANLGSTLQSTLAAAGRVLDVLDETPLVADLTGFENIAFQGAAARDVTFSYGGENVLSDVSIEIPENKIIGIVGKSGSGKSTLLKLMMRFWRVQDGEMIVSGRNLETVNTANLREMESLVTQETHLFHDSIENNLRLAKADATMDELITACKKASVHDFIERLPLGYATPVGELGDTLSGGERQRLGLAMAFLHDAPFLLLDEPTSNLDSLNEAVILKALSDAREGQTVALVSHRASTVSIANAVFHVENHTIRGQKTKE